MKNVIITGVSGHLGSITASYFLSKGYQVWGVLKPGQKLEIPGLQIIYLHLDDEDAVKNGVLHIKSTIEKTDILIAMAGGFDMGDLEQTDLTAIDKMMATNFNTVYPFARQIFLWMKETGGGQIFLTGARSAVEGEGQQTVAYTLSKSAVMTLNQLLNDAGKPYSIRSYAVVPSIIDTPANRRAMPTADFTTWVLPEHIAKTIHFYCEEAGMSNQIREIKIYNHS